MTVSLLHYHISRWWRCERWEEIETLGNTEDTGQQTQAHKTQGEVILNPH
jgi:hypothetical protein